MDAPDDTFSSLLARARGLGAPIVAVDVRASSGRYEAEFGRSRTCLVVRAALAQPGDEDSRYRIVDLDRLVAEDPEAASAAMKIARRLADEVGAVLHPSGPEPPKNGDPSWIALQGPSPEREWTAWWTTVTWRADGTEVHTRGEGPSVGRTAREAIFNAKRRLPAMAPPFQYELGVRGVEGSSGGYSWQVYPAAAPPVETLRAQALAGEPLSAILNALAAAAPTLAPLDWMVALEHAFKIDLEHLGPVSAFAAGTLDAAGLEAALGGRVRKTQPQWSILDALREAHARGDSIGPVLRAFSRDLGTLDLNGGVGEAFGLSMSTSRRLVARSENASGDAALDAMLAEELAAKRG